MLKKKKKHCSKNVADGNRIIIIVLSLVMIIFLSLLILESFNPLSLTQVRSTNSSNVLLNETYLKILNSRYKSDTSEFVYCLYGKETSEGLMITELRETKVLEADGDSIIFVSCKKSGDYLGSIHSHPKQPLKFVVPACSLSSMDVYSFGGDGSVLIGVMCGVDKFGWFTPTDLDNSLKTVIV